MRHREDAAGREVAELPRPLRDEHDLDPLLDRIDDARFVLLGEASHGTAEYYRWRAELTRRLIADRGFSFVGVEGDWPDCFRINRWVKDWEHTEESARQVLNRFGRWPTWMWANEEVADFVDWLRDHNRHTGGDVGFYGLDAYSLWASLRGHRRLRRRARQPRARGRLRRLPVLRALRGGPTALRLVDSDRPGGLRGRCRPPVEGAPQPSCRARRRSWASATTCCCRSPRRRRSARCTMSRCRWVASTRPSPGRPDGASGHPRRATSALQETLGD